MNGKECADILRETIRHRERTHEKEMAFFDENGRLIGRGKVEPAADELYQALKYALRCVEKEG